MIGAVDPLAGTRRHPDAESGEGKVTPLVLFSSGILELEPQIWELIRAAA